MTKQTVSDTALSLSEISMQKPTSEFLDLQKAREGSHEFKESTSDYAQYFSLFRITKPTTHRKLRV